MKHAISMTELHGLVKPEFLAPDDRLGGKDRIRVRGL
jgi:hypothetical protein